MKYNSQDAAEIAFLSTDAAAALGVDVVRLNELVCESRVHSVRGNMDERAACNIGCVIPAMIKDVLDDYCLEVAELNKKQRKAVGKVLGPKVAPLVRRVIMGEGSL